MKKVYIALALLVLILAIALAAFRFGGSKEAIESLDADCAYPYSYVADKKGLTITISGDFPKGSTWIARTLGTAVSVEAKGNQKSNGASFVITPETSGMDKAVFSLMGGENKSEFLYEISAEVMVDQTGAVSLVNNYHREPDEVRIGEIGEAVIRAASDADGSVKIQVKGGTSFDWVLDYDADCITADWEYENFDANEKTLVLRYHELGQGTVRILDYTDRQAVALEIYTDLLKNVKIESFAIQEFDPAVTE